MSKLLYFNQQYLQSAAFAAVNYPVQPLLRKHLASDRRVSDPSSGLPIGQCYPVPPFFDYRAKPKEQDLL